MGIEYDIDLFSTVYVLSNPDAKLTFGPSGTSVTVGDTVTSEWIMYINEDDSVTVTDSIDAGFGLTVEDDLFISDSLFIEDGANIGFNTDGFDTSGFGGVTITGTGIMSSARVLDEITIEIS